jgi:hypothetical protein
MLATLNKSINVIVSSSGHAIDARLPCALAAD